MPNASTFSRETQGPRERTLFPADDLNVLRPVIAWPQRAVASTVIGSQERLLSSCTASISTAR